MLISQSHLIFLFQENRGARQHTPTPDFRLELRCRSLGDPVLWLLEMETPPPPLYEGVPPVSPAPSFRARSTQLFGGAGTAINRKWGWQRFQPVGAQ